jgi:hypothetical protein
MGAAYIRMFSLAEDQISVYISDQTNVVVEGRPPRGLVLNSPPTTSEAEAIQKNRGICCPQHDRTGSRLLASVVGRR